MNNTYLTTEELSERIKYDPRTIRQCLKAVSYTHLTLPTILRV